MSSSTETLDFGNRVPKDTNQKNKLVYGLETTKLGQISLNAVITKASDPEHFKDDWTPQSCLEWGKHFMLANDGLQPSEPALDELSKKTTFSDRFRKSEQKSVVLPPIISIVHSFGSFESYANELEPAYLAWQEERERSRQQDLEKLESEIQSGDVPIELFADFPSYAYDDKTGLERWAKWQVVSSFSINIGSEEVSGILPDTVYKWCGRALPQEDGSWAPQPTSKGFTGYLRKYSFDSNTRVYISAGDVQLAALSLGVHDYIWPLENDVKTLKI